jgi:hypothetical protein
LFERVEGVGDDAGPVVAARMACGVRRDRMHAVLRARASSR